MTAAGSDFYDALDPHEAGDVVTVRVAREGAGEISAPVAFVVVEDSNGRG